MCMYVGWIWWVKGVGDGGRGGGRGQGRRVIS